MWSFISYLGSASLHLGVSVHREQIPAAHPGPIYLLPHIELVNQNPSTGRGGDTEWK